MGNSTEQNSRRCIGIDVGESRIGVAVSDPLGMFAQPYKTVERKKDQTTVAEIAQIVSEQDAGVVVVGLPRELSGAVGEQADKVTKFAEKLEKLLSRTGVKVVFWDERFTSHQAERIVAGSKLKNDSRHAALDRISASLILESYLDWLRSQP